MTSWIVKKINYLGGMMNRININVLIKNVLQNLENIYKALLDERKC